jgi:hypothetical protein
MVQLVYKELLVSLDLQVSLVQLVYKEPQVSRAPQVSKGPVWR